MVQDHSILHTTLARLVAPPRVDPAGQQGDSSSGSSGGSGSTGAGGAAGEAAAVLQRAVDDMTGELCGLRAVMDQIW